LHPETKRGAVNQYTKSANPNKSEQQKSFTHDTSEKLGISRDTIENEIKIAKSLKPEVKEVVRKINLAKTDALKLARMEPEKQKEIVAKIESGEAKSVDDAIKKNIYQERENKREQERVENSAKLQKLNNPLEAQGIFQTIVIDPPWDWGDEGDVNQLGRAKPDYATMPIEEIEKLPIAKIADKNCHLYLWVTNRSLPKAFRLLDIWGFRYITCLTWVKPHYGMGNYFRGSTEQILFGVRGSQPLKRHDVGTHFNAPRGKEHSSKPDEFYRLIESCSYAPYIDIFGRKKKESWVIWGENG
jgi:N6-adenosine-specific RNA methylase IME4